MSDDDSATISCTEATQVKNLERRWLCPWGSTVVDDVAPAFKSILEESHISSGSPVEDTREHRNSWWKKRKTLDHHLKKFLRYDGSLSERLINLFIFLDILQNLVTPKKTFYILFSSFVKILNYGIYRTVFLSIFLIHS